MSVENCVLSIECGYPDFKLARMFMSVRDEFPEHMSQRAVGRQSRKPGHIVAASSGVRRYNAFKRSAMHPIGYDELALLLIEMVIHPASSSGYRVK